MKNHVTLLFLTMLLYCICLSSLHAQTFPCNGSFYISLNNSSSPTTTHQIAFTGTAVEFDQIVQSNVHANAFGYNPKDHYIYGVNRDNNDIIRIFSTGGFEVVGEEPEISNWVTGAGDCNYLGKYAVHERSNDKLYFYDVTNGFTPETSVVLQWSPNSGNTGIANLALDDIVFDPNDPTIIYSYQRNFSFGSNSEPVNSRGAILQINADYNSSDFGNVDILGILSDEVILQMGALFFNSSEELFGYGSSVVPIVQNTLVRIDLTNMEAIFMANGPGAAGNDGCSCPFNVELKQEIYSLDQQCDSTQVEYKITLMNNSNLDLTNLIFQNTFEFNAKIQHTFPQDALNGDVQIDGNQIQIYNIDIAANSKDSFILQIQYQTIDGFFSNQSSISGLPEVLNATVVSDDPNTSAFLDPTTFEIETDQASFTQFIEETICFGEQYELHGINYDQSGTYLQEIEGHLTGECDSIIELNLTVLAENISEQQYTHCDAGPYLFGDMPLSTSGLYERTLENAGRFGCDSTIRLELEVPERLGNIYFPNTINPISQLGNDCFRLFFENNNTFEYSMSIYDRWGNLIFDDQGVDICWDGTFSGQAVQAGIYSYIIEINDSCQGAIQRVGELLVHY